MRHRSNRPAAASQRLRLRSASESPARSSARCLGKSPLGLIEDAHRLGAPHDERGDHIAQQRRLARTRRAVHREEVSPETIRYRQVHCALLKRSTQA
jgi:hypothetical protein